MLNDLLKYFPWICFGNSSGTFLGISYWETSSDFFKKTPGKALGSPQKLFHIFFQKSIRHPEKCLRISFEMLSGTPPAVSSEIISIFFLKISRISPFIPLCRFPWIPSPKQHTYHCQKKEGLWRVKRDKIGTLQHHYFRLCDWSGICVFVVQKLQITLEFL